MDLVGKLLNELEHREQLESAVDGFEDMCLEPGERVEMVSSTFARDTIIYIYAVPEPGKRTRFICSYHSDGGVVTTAN
jgi:hypothetical protein